MAVVKKDSGFSTTTVAVKLAELQGQQNQIASDVTEIKKVVQENAQAHGERLKVLEKDLDTRSIVAQYKRNQWKAIAAWVGVLAPVLSAAGLVAAKLIGIKF